MNTMKIQVNILLVLVYIVLHNCFDHIYLPHELFPILPCLPYAPYFFFKKNIQDQFMLDKYSWMYVLLLGYGQLTRGCSLYCLNYN